MIVKDDYLEQYENPYVLRTFNSTDYRNLFITQRLGDYVAGVDLSLYAPKAVIFGADYQIVFNHNALAEHYASLNIETAFSKKVKLYGYGTMDLVQLLPSSTLAAIQIDPVDTFFPGRGPRVLPARIFKRFLFLDLLRPVRQPGPERDLHFSRLPRR